MTLHGPGGVGKTRLAAEVARAARQLFPSGRAFIELVSAREGYVAQAVAAAIDVSERPDRRLEDAIADRLGSGRFLLVLDNCAHLIDAAASLAERLLTACPGLRILATSRERLGIRVERVIRLAPLPLGSDAELAIVAGLPDAERLLAAAALDASQSAWAAACVDRATWRLDADDAAPTRSAQGWERSVPDLSAPARCC